MDEEAEWEPCVIGGRYGVCGVTTGYRTELHLGNLFTRRLEVFAVVIGSKEDMRQIVEMLNRGKIHPVVHQAFPLSEAAAAHLAMDEHDFSGKLLLKP